MGHPVQGFALIDAVVHATLLQRGQQLSVKQGPSALSEFADRLTSHAHAMCAVVPGFINQLVGRTCSCKL